MYYPIGWHKVLKLDTQYRQADDEEEHFAPSEILSVQANHERELFFILTTRSLHIWFPRPAAEIVCHKRSKESIERVGLNRHAIWRPDSSVIVVATERDQLLFFQLRRRSTPNSATAYLLPGSSDNSDSIYRLKYDARSVQKLLNNETTLPAATPMDESSSSSDQIPALTIFSFGKLDLSSIGISCLMSAEEELVVGARNGEIYGVHWNGNVDEKFPWSLSKEVSDRGDYLIDLKFSKVLVGFALVFRSGRIGFMPLKIEQQNDTQEQDNNTFATNISYLSGVKNAIRAEINHRHRLVAFGLKNSKVIVCNIGESNSLVINHTLDLANCKNSHHSNATKLGRVECLKYSPDNFALVTSWENGHFAIWSVFGSLLFCSQQWQQSQECDLETPLKPMVISSLDWGQEGYNLWIKTSVGKERQERHQESDDQQSTSSSSMVFASNGNSAPATTNSANLAESGSAGEGLKQKTSVVPSKQRDEIRLLSLAHCNLSTSPHLTCSSDSLVLMTEDKLYVGPSVPHEDKFDHWIVVSLPQDYLNAEYPIRYATVDRGCDNLAVAGHKGLAVYSIASRKWRFLEKKSQAKNFSVCGDLIWWRDYLIGSCFNYENGSFELRAYPMCSAGTSQESSLSNQTAIIRTIKMEIIRMSIFENRLLALYGDGTLGMFMLNLRRRPGFTFNRRQPDAAGGYLFSRSNSIVSNAAGPRPSIVPNNTDNSPQLSGSLKKRSDSIVSYAQSLDSNNPLTKLELTLHIAPIENLIISNLQANPFCISSIALTRLHFKNNRHDDSILLNACGKLFLLEREAPPGLLSAAASPVSDKSSPDLKDLSLESHKSNSSELEMKVQSAKTLTNSLHFASASLKQTTPAATSTTTTSHSNSVSNNTAGALSSSSLSSSTTGVTFKAVSVIATNVEQFWISPEISSAPEMSYFKKSLWLSCGGNSGRRLQVWLPLLNDQKDPPSNIYVPDRIMLPIKCDIYPLAIRSSSSSSPSSLLLSSSASSTTSGSVITEMPDDAIVLGAESDVLYRDCQLFNGDSTMPYLTVKRQCRVYLHKILRELLLSQHLGYYAKKIAESCQSLPYFAHCFELLLHEVLEEEATSPVPMPDPMLPQIVRFIKEFPVYLETVVHCARKSDMSMWSHLFDERAVGNPRRLFQDCIEQQKLDTAASCLIILQNLDKSIVSSRMVKELIVAAKESPRFHYLVEDLESFLIRAELEDRSQSTSPASTTGGRNN